MRISDWSADVCSSDLGGDLAGQNVARADLGTDIDDPGFVEVAQGLLADVRNVARDVLGRSEERRVGKECGSRCRSRWSPNHYKQQAGTYRTIIHCYMTIEYVKLA